jgi:long-chain acyl-CoA synthetase
MYHGATYIIHPHFEPDTFIETIARERVTHVMMIPLQIIALLHSSQCEEGSLPGPRPGIRRCSIHA